MVRRRRADRVPVSDLRVSADNTFTTALEPARFGRDLADWARRPQAYWSRERGQG